MRFSRLVSIAVAGRSQPSWSSREPCGARIRSCGEHSGRVRALFDDAGRAITEAGPSTPVEVLGLGGVPIAGDPVHATDELTARTIAEHRREARRRRELGTANTISAQSLLDKLRAGERPVLRLILKADTQGTAEAMRDALGDAE